MDIKLRSPIGFFPGPSSPEVVHGKEAIRIAVTRVSAAAGWVEIDLAATFSLPESVGERYRHLPESFVLVVNDVEQVDGAALRLENAFIEYAPTENDGPNQIREPDLPMPGRGGLQAQGFQGGWINLFAAVSSPVGVPRYRPSVYLYLVLENYVSNVIGLDLVDQKAISF